MKTAYTLRLLAEPPDGKWPGYARVWLTEQEGPVVQGRLYGTMPIAVAERLAESLGGVIIERATEMVKHYGEGIPLPEHAEKTAKMLF